VEEPLDLFLARPGMIASEIPAHQIKPGLEQIERSPERIRH